MATPFALENAPYGKMAKVKFSALVSEMRNKLNGSVFSKNRAGNYLRNKVTPVNPQTSFQTAVRSALTAASQAWRALTEAQRTAWNNAVSNFTGTDIFGDVKTPSGINLQNKLYLNANTIGGTPLTTPPSPGVSVAAPDVTIVTDSAPQTFTVSSPLAAVPAGESWVISATENSSPGINNFKGKYRVVAVLPAATPLPYAGIAAYTTKFGAVVANQKIGVEVKAISSTTFIQGPATRLISINL